MKNLLSYCGLGDLRISASDKDLPVSGTAVIKRSKTKVPRH